MGFLTPTASGELDVLRTYALHQLAQIRTTAYGLTDDQARATPTASSLHISALLRHAGEVAVYWSAAAASAPREPTLPEGMEDHSLEDLAADATPVTETLAFFDECVRLTRANFDAVTDLSAPAPVPDVPWVPADLTSWEARWCLVHISTEIARHTGHADIIRESIDGKGSYELNDLAEGI